jgi:hypothetical protein
MNTMPMMTELAFLDTTIICLPSFPSFQDRGSDLVMLPSSWTLAALEWGAIGTKSR